MKLLLIKPLPKDSGILNAKFNLLYPIGSIFNTRPTSISETGFAYFIITRTDLPMTNGAENEFPILKTETRCFKELP